MPDSDHTVIATTASGTGGPVDEAELAKTLAGGRYEILHRIGSGGMGVVFKAFDARLGRAVAIKVVASRSDSSTAQDHLVREAWAMAKLRHPNVVAVHDMGALGERFFIVMELVEGGTLSDWLKAQPRGWREVLGVFLQAARGLAAVHAAGIVHRDFKPENVLFGKDGVVRVSDFGVVRLMDDAEDVSDGHTTASAVETATGSRTIVGTPGYIAPEIVHQHTIDARADQFSFSVALHLGLYGKRPFKRADGEDRMRETLGEPAPVPSGIAPRWLERLVARGLSAKPGDRWPSMADLANAMERGLRRRSMVAMGGTVALVVLASAGVVVALRRSAPAGPDWVPALMGPQSPDTLDVSISRSGGAIAYAKESEIIVEPRLGGERRHVLPPPGAGKIARAGLSRTGDTVFAELDVENGKRALWALDATGRGGLPQRLLPSDSAPDVELSKELFDISPDDRPLVVLDLPGRPRAGLASVDAGGPHVILEAAPGERFLAPVWSPDGTRVAVWENLGGSTPVKILDVATHKASTVLSGGDGRGCDWLSSSSLICLSARPDRTAMVEVELSSSLEVGAAHDRYILGPFEIVTVLHATEAGVFFATWSMGARLQSLDLEHPGALRALASESITDLPAAGWRSDGSLVFGADMRGRLQTMAREVTGRVDVVRSNANGEVPLVVLGDSIVFGSFPAGELSIPRIDTIYGRKYPEHGELFRLDPGRAPAPLGPTSGFVALRCAGDQAPPCLLIEHSGDEVRAIEWDPETGARGREAAHWSLSERSYQALAPDGHTLAQVLVGQRGGAGDIELLDLQDGSVRNVAYTGYAFRNLTWQPDGTLVATAYVDDGYIVSRLRAGASPEVLFSSATIFPLEPRVRPDGKEMVVPVNAGTFMYWWVAK